MPNPKTEEEYVRDVIGAAECGDLEALYNLGALHDVGEAVPLDRELASTLFKEAADRGHAHSMWIHACELLWGLGTFEQSVSKGLTYLEKAVEARSAEACVTMARLCARGELGVELDSQRAAEFGALAKQYDAAVYNPYA